MGLLGGFLGILKDSLRKYASNQRRFVHLKKKKFAKILLVSCQKNQIMIRIRCIFPDLDPTWLQKFRLRLYPDTQHSSSNLLLCKDPEPAFK
jgi:hypothetical protein